MGKLIFIPVIAAIALASTIRVDVPGQVDDRPMVPDQFRDRCNLVDDAMSYMEDNQMTDTREYHLLSSELEECVRLQGIFRWK